MSSWFSTRKLVAGVCLLIAIIAFTYIDWDKDPNKRVLGYWQEPNLHLYAHVIPGKVTVFFTDGRTRSFHYEIHPEESPYPFEVWQGERSWGEFYRGQLEFHGKDEAKLRGRENPDDISDSLSAYASKFTMTWKRIPESAMPVVASGKEK